MHLALSIKYWLYHKKKALFILCSVSLCMAAMVISTLLVRSHKLGELDGYLQKSGDYDFAFYQLTEEGEQSLRADEHFSEFGEVYRSGYIRGNGGTDYDAGYVADARSEEMLHLTPVKGRYPRKSGEICIDRLTLKSLGYPARIGQEVELECLDFEKNPLQTRTFSVVGLIEKVTMGTVGRPEVMQRYAPEGVDIIIDAPYVYMTKEDAEAVYGTEADKILYANVAASDEFDEQDVRTELSDAYWDDDTNRPREGVGYLVDLFSSFADRSYMAQCMAGFFENGIEPAPGNNGGLENLRAGAAKKDFYSAVLIPVFFALAMLCTFFSLYNALSMAFAERIRQNGMLRCIGMSRAGCGRHLVAEALVLLVPGILAGYGLGFLAYAAVLQFQRAVFDIPVIAAWSVSDYYRPYLEAVTADPVTFPLCAIGIAVIPAILFPALRSGRISPTAACRGEERLYRKQKRFYAFLYANMFLVLGGAVFGYCYFRADSDFKNEGAEAELEAAGCAEYDYYGEQNKLFTNTGYGGEVRHDSGVSREYLEQLKDTPGISSAEGVIINLSTRIAVTEPIAALAGMEVTSLEGLDPALTDIYLLRNAREMAYRGYEADETVYQVPSVGLEDGAWEQMEAYLVEGSIDLERIKEGREVVLAVQNAAACPYHAGDTLPLSDDVYPEQLDSDPEFQGNLPPEGMEPTYEAEGDNWAQYCTAKRKRLDPVVGAVMVITDEFLLQKYFFDDYGSGFPWNVLVSDETFQSWGLPDSRYSRVWAACREDADTEAIEAVWYSAMEDGKLMRNFVVADIRAKIVDEDRSSMLMFFSMLAAIAAVSIAGMVNTVRVSVTMGRKRLALMRVLGMEKRRLILQRMRRDFFWILIGGVVSLLPVAVFQMIAQYGLKLRAIAREGGAVLPLDHWAASFPVFYELTDYHPAAVAAAAALAVMAFSAITTVLCMKKELDGSIVDGIREQE